MSINTDSLQLPVFLSKYTHYHSPDHILFSNMPWNSMLPLLFGGHPTVWLCTVSSIAISVCSFSSVVSASITNWNRRIPYTLSAPTNYFILLVCILLNEWGYILVPLQSTNGNSSCILNWFNVDCDITEAFLSAFYSHPGMLVLYLPLMFTLQRLARVFLVEFWSYWCIARVILELVDIIDRCERQRCWIKINGNERQEKTQKSQLWATCKDSSWSDWEWSYTAWNSGEPNDVGYNENCVH